MAVHLFERWTKGLRCSQPLHLYIVSKHHAAQSLPIYAHFPTFTQFSTNHPNYSVIFSLRHRESVEVGKRSENHNCKAKGIEMLERALRFAPGEKHHHAAAYILPCLSADCKLFLLPPG